MARKGAVVGRCGFMTPSAAGRLGRHRRIPDDDRRSGAVEAPEQMSYAKFHVERLDEKANRLLAGPNRLARQRWPLLLQDLRRKHQLHATELRAALHVHTRQWQAFRVL